MVSIRTTVLSSTLKLNPYPFSEFSPIDVRSRNCKESLHINCFFVLLNGLSLWSRNFKQNGWVKQFFLFNLSYTTEYMMKFITKNTNAAKCWKNVKCSGRKVHPNRPHFCFRHVAANSVRPYKSSQISTVLVV